MKRSQIERVAEELGWKTTFIKQKDDWYVEFNNYTSIGQNVIVPVNAFRLYDVPEGVRICYEDFDVSEETALWIGSDGHGKNGAPHHIEDILNDMKEAEQMIYDLAIALAQLL